MVSTTHFTVPEVADIVMIAATVKIVATIVKDINTVTRIFFTGDM
jgi:hypothetical protein